MCLVSRPQNGQERSEAIFLGDGVCCSTSTNTCGV
jgi:hypothetical protein